MSERNWQEDWDWVTNTNHTPYTETETIAIHWLQEIKRLREIETQLNQAMRNILTVTKDSGAWTTGARVAFIVNDTLRKVYGDEDKSENTLGVDPTSC